MRRVVLEHTQGDHKGMMQILGPAEPLTFGGRPLPEFLPPQEFMGRRVEFASLIKVTPRMVLYREAFPKPVNRFGSTPTMESWNPRQV